MYFTLEYMGYWIEVYSMITNTRGAGARQYTDTEHTVRDTLEGTGYGDDL